MMLRINRLHFPVTVLGPGRRLGLWLQGCGIGCSGCVSRDTWDVAGGTAVEVASLVETCQQMTGGGVDGLTITGGEPFEQPVALAAFLDALAGWRAAAGFDVLCYSGLPLKRLERDHAGLLARIDALIPEPFIEAQATDAPWRGSQNQPLVLFSDLARQRYAAPEAARALQVEVGPELVWFIGIPRRGDMERIRALAAQRGLAMQDVSWRS